MNSTIISVAYYNYWHHLPFELTQVQYMHSERNYTCFMLRYVAAHLTSKILNTYQAHLPAYMLRVHKSYIVNLHFVAVLDRTQRSLIMQDGQVIPIARRRWEWENV